MGEVWAATSQTDQREVAIKVLLARAAMKPDLVRRFKREAEIASSIKSPYVCQFIEVGEAEDGAHLLVFEQLTGESLADRLKREHDLPFIEVGPIIDDVLQGLAAAHAAGVVHRDLKPGNIFLERLVVDERSHPSGSPAAPRLDEPEERYERAKILDFGISKLTRREKEEPTLTAFDATLGSFAYMAPEQVRGAKGADERADIYAVGAVTFRALSGRLPFEGTTAAVLVAMKLDRSAPSLTEATGERWPAGIERFLERALERKREHRFATAAEALAAWRSIQPANITRARRGARPRTDPPPEPPPTLPPEAPDPRSAAALYAPSSAGGLAGVPPTPRSQPLRPSSRQPLSSYPPPEDHPTEVDNPPTMTVDSAAMGDPREPGKRRKTGRS
jgi:eukaryotic-like serine/threonine-protein kinase